MIDLPDWVAIIVIGSGLAALAAAIEANRGEKRE